jgi:hypothetical protein
MRRAFIYASIGLTILVLFTANSVIAQAWGDYWIPSWTIATDANEIMEAADNRVGSLGVANDATGCIMVVMDDEFYNGTGWDIAIYGYDTDTYIEQYEVYFGIWDGTPQIMTCEPIGTAYDTDGIQYFNIIGDGVSDMYNMIYLNATSGSPFGDLPGPEIDAIYARYT